MNDTEDLELACWLFERYVELFAMQLSPRRKEYEKQGLDGETAHGLHLNLKSHGFRIGIVWGTGTREVMTPNRSYILLRWVLIRAANPTGPILTHKDFFVAVPNEEMKEMVEFIRANIGRMTTPAAEIGRISAEEQETLLKDIGIDSPPH